MPRAALSGPPLCCTGPTLTRFLVCACADLSAASWLPSRKRPRPKPHASQDAKTAEAEFLRGVTWLHSFMYEDAIDAFRAAQKIDPSFAMAYWGEAMSFSQPLWFFEEVDKGRAALAKLGPTPEARIAKAKTPREQGFLRAVEALFGPGDTAARAAAHAAGDGEGRGRESGRR